MHSSPIGLVIAVMTGVSLASIVSLAQPVQYEDRRIDKLDNSGFGSSVDLRDTILCVGATRHDNAGAVYVYERSAGGDIVERLLKPADLRPQDGFGSSVSVNGDRILIGAVQQGDGDDRYGAAYIFKRDGDEWVEEAVLTDDGIESSDRFGYPVLLMDDFALVAAQDRGTVYPYAFNGAEWTALEPVHVGSGFGSSMAFDGHHLVIGVPGDSEAHVYRRENRNFVHETTIRGEQGSHFGRNLDVDNGRIVVAAPWEGPRGNEGALRIYERIGEEWLLVASFATPSNRGDSGIYNCALEGDWAVAVLPWATTEYGRTGFTISYQFDGETWSPTAELVPSDANADYWTFGESGVDLEGERLLISANPYWWPWSIGGSVYEFRLGEHLTASLPQPGRLGEVNRWSAAGATPDASVLFAFSTGYGQTAVPGCPELSFALDQPEIIEAPTDSEGRAAIERFVPRDIGRRQLRFQVVDTNTCEITPVRFFRCY